MDSVNNVRNLALSAALDAQGVPSVGTREFNPPRYGDLPKPINVGAGLMIMPEYFIAEGWIGNEKVRDFYSAQEYGIDSARFTFQQKHYASGIRGVTVHPLYNLQRYV